MDKTLAGLILSGILVLLTAGILYFTIFPIANHETLEVTTVVNTTQTITTAIATTASPKIPLWLSILSLVGVVLTIGALVFLVYAVGKKNKT